MRTITVWAIVFLVLLRLAIGWQFFLEGAQKVRSNYFIGPSEISKPFSSEGYFRGAQGPFATLIRGRLPDPDEQLLSYTTLQPAPADKAPQDLSPALRMPPALGSTWDGYLETVLGLYPFEGTQQDRAREAVRQAKAGYVHWLLAGDKEVARTVSGKEVKLTLTTQHRLDEYRKALADLREYEDKRWRLGRDVDRDGQTLARARVIELRNALMKDIEEQTDKMRQAVAAVVRMQIDATLTLPAEPRELESELVKLLTPGPAADREVSAEYPLAAYVPAALDARWRKYRDALQTQLRVGEAQTEVAQRLLDRARHETVAWLLDLDVQGPRAASLAGLVAGGSPLSPLVLATSAAARATNPGPLDRLMRYQALREQVEKLRKEQATVGLVTFAPSPQLEAAEKALEEQTKSLKADLDEQTKRMKAGLEEMLTDAQKKVAAPKTPEGWTFIKALDLVTIGVITVAGLLLLLGLLTRTACVLAAGFLFLTFLSAPPLPWLPLPPATEGNPIYINKNLIEFFALLALAGLPTGKWFGIDTLFGRREAEPEPEPEPAEEQG